jgi:hypothetical protein
VAIAVVSNPPFSTWFDATQGDFKKAKLQFLRLVADELSGNTDTIPQLFEFY